jgi:hypothetical protein
MADGYKGLFFVCLGTVVIRGTRGQTPVARRARLLPPRLPHRPCWRPPSGPRSRRVYKGFSRIRGLNAYADIYDRAYALFKEIWSVIHICFLVALIVLSTKKRRISKNSIKPNYDIATTRLSRSFSLNIPPRGPTRVRKESSLGIQSGFSLWLPRKVR